MVVFKTKRGEMKMRADPRDITQAALVEFFMINTSIINSINSTTYRCSPIFISSVLHCFGVL